MTPRCQSSPRPLLRAWALLMLVLVTASLLVAICTPLLAAALDPPRECAVLRSTLTREARVRFGLDAPVPLLTGMIYQESSCNPSARNRYDGGAGLGQLTGQANIDWITDRGGFGAPDVFNPAWNLRASFWLLDWGNRQLQAVDECQRYGAGLFVYNAGIKYGLQAQRKSREPGVWFGATELIDTTQSEENWRYSHDYPRRIIYRHQPRFSAWGRTVCF